MLVFGKIGCSNENCAGNVRGDFCRRVSRGGGSFRDRTEALEGCNHVRGHVVMK